SAFVEATLAQIYKEVKDGEYRGGPAFYIEKGLGIRWYAVVFAVATIISASLLLPGVQSNSIAVSMEQAFQVPPLYSGLAIALLLGFVIFGGVKRIGKVAEVIVPFMALGYILMAVVIISMNISQVPAMISLI